MEATLQKVQQELKSDEWELRVDGLKALTKLGEETTGAAPAPAERYGLRERERVGERERESPSVGILREER